MRYEVGKDGLGRAIVGRSCLLPLLLVMILLTNYGASGIIGAAPMRPTCLSSGLRLAIPGGGNDVAMDNGVGVGDNRQVRLSILVPMFHSRMVHVRIAPSRILLVSHVGGHCIQTAHSRLGKVLPRGTSFSQLRGLLFGTSLPNRGGRLAKHRLKVPSLRGTGIELSSFSATRFRLVPARMSSECARMTLRSLLGVLVGL